MATDPQHLTENLGDPLGRIYGSLGETGQRVRALERQHVDARAVVGAGPPTFTPPMEGFMYVDTISLRLYVRVAGAWKYATLA